MKIELGYIATAAAVSMNFIDEINAYITTVTLLATLVFWIVKNVRLLKQGKPPDLNNPGSGPAPIGDESKGAIN